MVLFLILQRGPDLRIFNIQPSDAGTYICLVSPDESDLIRIADEDISSESSNEQISDSSFLEGLTIVLKVRSVPGPVSKLSVRLSTILGVLMWEFHSNHSGGYPIKSFTAEYREYCDFENSNASSQQWERYDPENIPANVVCIFFKCLDPIFVLQNDFFLHNVYFLLILKRYFEVFHLTPNSTYEFRIWANNFLGPGEIVSTSATTLCSLTDQSKSHRLSLHLFLRI